MAAARLSAALVLAALAGCGGGSEPPASVEAVFEQPLPRMQPGDPVRVAGVEVGVVEEVRRRGKAGTLVLRQDPRPPSGEWPVAADATARIRPRIFKESGYFVDLAPLVPEGGEPLRDGDRIAGSVPDHAPGLSQAGERLDECERRYGRKRPEELSERELDRLIRCMGGGSP